MRADEIRSHRLQALLKIYKKYGEGAVIARAIQMGVTRQTALSYLATIRSRVK